MAGFQSPVDLANAALAMLRKPAINSFADPEVEAYQIGAQYDQLRLAELRRNTWVFATRRVWLRPVSGTTQAITFPAWASGTAYKAGDVVSYNNALWVALVGNGGNTPGTTPSGGQLFWDTYFGVTTVDVWNGPVEPQLQTNTGVYYPTTYQTGEFAYVTPGDGTYSVFRSLVNNNGNNPQSVDQWVDSANYNAGQVVQFNSVNYQSTVNLNSNNQPPSAQWTTTITSPLVSNSWEEVNVTLNPMTILYPVNTGPLNDAMTRNVFVLPNGFLRKAHPAPKHGQLTWLGGPQPFAAPDWVMEGPYLISATTHPLAFRFIADTQNVPAFDALFSEGLAMRLAITLAPRLAEVETMPAVVAAAREAYGRCITEARTINGIEMGAQYPPESPLITVRY